MDFGLIAIIFFGIFLLCMFSGHAYTRKLNHERMYKNLEIGDKFFLLDTWTGNKCLIEVEDKSPYIGSEKVTVKDAKGNIYTYTMADFFDNVLIKNSRYYYEKLDKDSFNNIN